MDNRESYESVTRETFLEELEPSYYYIVPLIISTDVVGLVVMLGETTFSNEQKKFLQFLTQLLVHKIDVL